MHLCRRVDGREQWQALQGLLTRARALADEGDRVGALQHVDRALEIDPHFLAAHSLKERLAPDGPAERSDASRPPEAKAEAPAAPAGLSAIEAKVLARRAERRLDTASEAIRRRDFALADAALDEAREIGADPGHLLSIERTLAEARRVRRRTLVTGRRVVMAATVLAGVLGARYVDDRLVEETAPDAAPTAAAATSTPGGSIGTAGITRPTNEIIKLQPAAPATTLDADPVSATRREESSAAASPWSDAAAATASSPRVVAPSLPMTVPLAPIAPPAPVDPPARAPASAVQLSDAVSSLPPAPVATPRVADVAAPARVADDENGVRDALQRYRAAYEQLNAQSARAVWPAVDERALARAFDSLSSQQFQFDACDVSVRGDAASAACRGTATYTPKVGSTDPHVEPRTWSFTLRKEGGQWAIQTARVGR